MRTAKRAANQRPGLTLIELIIVLVVLVALAAIIIPMLPNMLTRAHTSAGATNISEVNKFVQVYQQLYQSMPQDLDNLAGTATAPVDYLPGTTVGGQVSARALTAAEADALIKAGITRTAGMHATSALLATNGGSPTFDPYDGTVQTVATGLQMAFVSEAAIEKTIARDEPGTGKTGDVYVVLGIGRRCSMVGKVVADPPTHFGENEASNAANVYCRFGLVFRVARGNGTATPTPLDRAVFVGAVAFHDDGIAGADAHLEEYYKITKSE